MILSTGKLGLENLTREVLLWPLVALGTCWTLRAEPPTPRELNALDNVAKRWSTPESTETPSFVKHVVPLFTKMGCSARTCHGSFQGQNGSG
jgi:hypothetical protein